MTLEGLAPMLEELRAVLEAKGCKITEVCVTLFTGEDEREEPAAVRE